MISRFWKAPLARSVPLWKRAALLGGPSVDDIGEGSPPRVVATPLPLPKPTNIVSSRKRLPDQVLLSTYIPPPPQSGMVAPDLESAWEIIHRRSPFNHGELLVAHMYDLYPNYFWIPVAARVE